MGVGVPAMALFALSLGSLPVDPSLKLLAAEAPPEDGRAGGDDGAWC